MYFFIVFVPYHKPSTLFDKAMLKIMKTLLLSYPLDDELMHSIGYLQMFDYRVNLATTINALLGNPFLQKAIYRDGVFLRTSKLPGGEIHLQSVNEGETQRPIATRFGEESSSLPPDAVVVDFPVPSIVKIL